MAWIALAAWPAACASEREGDEPEAGEEDLSDLPDEAQNYFPGMPELRSSELQAGKYVVRAKIDPHTGKPLLVYRVPVEVTEQEALDTFVRPRLDASYALVAEDAAGPGSFYALTYQGTRIESGWTRVYKDKRGAPVIAMSLPTEGLTPHRFAGAVPTGLTIVAGTLTEFRRSPGGPGESRDEFPPDVGIPGGVSKVLTAVKSAASVTKIPVQQGTFPDQIGQTRAGDIWFSQPQNNVVTRYRADTGAWLRISVGSEPDGLSVDRNDNVWFGEYGNHALGFIATDTGQYTSYHVPDALGSQAPAIPFMDADGIVWVADHQANMMLRFDPQTKGFEAHPIPTASSWPVGVGQAADGNVVYIAETYGHKVAAFDKTTKTYREYALGTNGGTAFFSQQGGALWFTEWSQRGFIRFDIQTHDTTEYTFQDGTDARLGPTAVLPDGRIGFGGLSNGRVYLFDPASERLEYVESIGSLKDGMTARGASELWVSEMGGVLDRIDWSATAPTADAGSPDGSGSDAAPPADARAD